MIVLCDVDATISDSRWRDPLLGNWSEYYPAGDHDPPVLSMIRMVNSMAILGTRVVHLTCRPERWRDLTMRWLVRHHVLSDGLIMRPDDCYLPSADLKPVLARGEFGEDIVAAGVGLVIDDKEAVLDRFRAMGVHTLLAGLGGVPARPEGD